MAIYLKKLICQSENRLISQKSKFKQIPRISQYDYTVLFINFLYAISYIFIADPPNKLITFL
jgi:hypothetical protein